MPLSPKKYNNDGCCYSISDFGFDNTVISNMEYSFELSPNYKDVYLINDSSVCQDFLHDKDMKNSYGLDLYKSWIYSGTEEEQTVGHKYIEMYPYKVPILKEGDYVAFDYYNNGEKSVWLCIALNSDSEYEQIGKIRMCTNEVRFYNENGELIRVPCVFDNKINSEKNTSLSNLKYINGITTIYMQLNEDSAQLRTNQRLIFGRPGAWTCFRIVSVGIDNFMNTVYFDNSSAKILEITMEAAYVNEETDDLINGIADANTFKIILSQNEISGNIGNTFEIDATVVKNDSENIEKEIIWETSNNEIVSVEDGNITLISEGNAVVTAYLKENNDVFATCNISVSSSQVEEYTVIFSPYSGEFFGILQGNKQIFECYLYLNGQKTEEVFSFSVETSAPNSCYEYGVLDGNRFFIKNIKMDYNEIFIKCVNEKKEFDAVIKLQGAW